MNREKYLTDPRFKGIEPFESKVWLSSPTMHGEEQRWVDEAIQTNWVSTVGANINEVEMFGRVQEIEAGLEIVRKSG